MYQWSLALHSLNLRHIAGREREKNNIAYPVGFRTVICNTDLKSYLTITANGKFILVAIISYQTVAQTGWTKVAPHI